jgi:hypothetical protein
MQLTDLLWLLAVVVVVGVTAKVVKENCVMGLCRWPEAIIVSFLGWFMAVYIVFQIMGLAVGCSQGFYYSPRELACVPGYR